MCFLRDEMCEGRSRERIRGLDLYVKVCKEGSVNHEFLSVKRRGVCEVLVCASKQI